MLYCITRLSWSTTALPSFEEGPKSKPPNAKSGCSYYMSTGFCWSDNSSYYFEDGFSYIGGTAALFATAGCYYDDTVVFFESSLLVNLSPPFFLGAYDAAATGFSSYFCSSAAEEGRWAYSYWLFLLIFVFFLLIWMFRFRFYSYRSDRGYLAIFLSYFDERGTCQSLSSVTEIF